MCGIVGIVGANRNVVADILTGLKKLEYRGYDSAGIALIDGASKEIKNIRQKGKIVKLEDAIAKDAQFIGDIAIGHTRWATHGKPSEENAHPHVSKDVAVVHNGIIENHQELRKKLQEQGVKLSSQTDTEVIPHLISLYLQQYNGDKKKAIFSCLNDIDGAFALAIIFKGEDDLIVVAKKGSPILIGYGEGENYIASDYFALDSLTNKISTVEDGDVAFLTKEEVTILNDKREVVSRAVKLMEKDADIISKEGYEHFMLKEIFEQPKVIQDSIDQYTNLKTNSINLPNFPFDLNKIDKIFIVACGTSYYAGMVGKYLIESLCNVNVEVNIASEFRYHNTPFHGKNLAIFISQSGETADSIAALKYVKSHNQQSLAIVNVIQSTMAHLADCSIRTVAGPEIGVASTKAYSAQLMVLILFAIKLAEERGVMDKKKKAELLSSLSQTPDFIKEILNDDSISKIQEISNSLKEYKNILYMGRGISYITAMEGALKLKELSYIHSQGIASGELKHGTIALVDKDLPIVAIAPNNNLFEKSASNIEEVCAREGKVVLISDKNGAEKLKDITFRSIALPKLDDVISEALLGVIPTQLIAYYVALYKGNDVDQPRNLAKSVTVE